jgi:hypothetical protein
VSAGAQWRVDGGTWQNSGATVSGLSVGNHPVTFNTVSGWTTPANQTAAISVNQTTPATGTYAAIPQLPKQLTGMIRSNGVFHFVLNGPAGSNYVVQVSSNLVDWLPLSTNIIPGGGSVPVADREASNHVRRFYRTMPPVPTPANDNFANRTLIQGASAVVTGSNTGASLETGEPFHWQSTGGKSVWWTWQAPASGSVVLTTGGSNLDTILAIYTGGSVASLILVESNDDFPGVHNGGSQVTFNAVAGTTYQIAVDGWGGANGNINLSITQ